VSASSELRVGICAIAKNEGRYLEEWITYHNLLGFRPILVYDHESTDDTASVASRLEAFGLMERVAWSPPVNAKPQWAAYEDAMGRFEGRLDWVAFIDLDEFIVLPQHQSVQAFLSEFGHLGPIAMNWKIFGSSGASEIEPGLVIERFQRCSHLTFKGNHMVKTLAPLDSIVVPRVHTCAFREGTIYRTVTGEHIPPGEGRSRLVTHDVIRVNHYFTKSAVEWEEKRERGKGAKRPGQANKRRRQSDFAANDRNEDEETEIITHIPRVLAAIRGRKGFSPRVGRTKGVDPAPATSDSGGPEPAVDGHAGVPVADPQPHMTDPEVDVLREYYSGAACIVEFGCGGSTLVALSTSQARIVSVESDPDWALRIAEVPVARTAIDQGRLHLKYVDIGPIRSWGRPRDDSQARLWPRYHAAPWVDWVLGSDPFVVLVDGRFRVACAFQAALRREKPFTLLVHDYTTRRRYRFIERYYTLERVVDTLAVFKPGNLSSKQLRRLGIDLQSFALDPR
jgi:hypothetical protein